MVHENADRAHVPGQPQVPERDIEPLWPPEQSEPGAGVPPWATPAQPGTPPWPLPPPPAAEPPRSPVHPTTGPAPHDPAAAGRGPDEVRPVSPVPAPRTQPPVDLDLPFTLDRPPVAPNPTSTAPEQGDPAAVTTAAQDGPTTDDGADRTGVGAHQAGGTSGGRTESPWAQPPQRSTAPTEPTDASATPTDPAATAVPAAPPATAGSVPPGPEAPAAEAPAGDAPSRLGPFPPAPGVPLAQPPYGNGSAYPPGPAGYGQPGYPAGPTPGWYPPAWPHQPAGPAPQPPATPGPEQPAPGAPQPAPGPQQPAQPAVPAGYPEPAWTPEAGATPTAEDFARRRQARPVDPVATMGVRAVVNKIGLVRLPPGRHEQELKRDIETVRRNFGGLRQVTVVNPKGGAGKTVAILLLAMTFGQKRGGYVLAWDNNETQGTLGMRAQQDFHSRTVRDMLRDLAQFQGAHGRVGDLSQYVRSQGEGMFDVLASDESATGGEMLTAAAFAEIREVVSRFYKLIFVDTGNNVRAQNWQAAMDATDQLVVTMSARNDSAETAARMLDHLEQSGRQRLVRQAVTVVSMPPSRKEIDLPAIQEHFAARTRAVLLAPYERLIDTGEPIRYGQLSSATRDAWLKIAAAVAEGL
ncbi:chromosome partitioning protein [Micromonospora soli]|uniref:MinD/ParA family ATP-binding protein n=1 Tax=Micromonospora sp. NBRC 110009 TaxID=3061627 RepID=UPI002672716C|nr:chromosome partitioning protein [Micromonospora sp. NBRC 110009]WKU00827.1 chromosome partitioning protein [Micromonospora sp. NBRC 110009]